MPKGDHVQVRRHDDEQALLGRLPPAAPTPRKKRGHFVRDAGEIQIEPAVFPFVLQPLPDVCPDVSGEPLEQRIRVCAARQKVLAYVSCDLVEHARVFAVACLKVRHIASGMHEARKRRSRSLPDDGVVMVDVAAFGAQVGVEDRSMIGDGHAEKCCATPLRSSLHPQRTHAGRPRGARWRGSGMRVA